MIYGNTGYTGYEGWNGYEILYWFKEVWNLFDKNSYYINILNEYNRLT